jgi:predicted nucleic acid-binding protein
VISYVDTSALVKLLLREEPGAEQVRGILDASDVAVTSRVTYPEGRAALSAAMRAGRLVAREHARSKRDLDRALASLTIVELDPSVARAAGDVSERFALRAYDAVHLASALVVDEGDTVVVTWDRALANAAGAAGLGVAPREA